MSKVKGYSMYRRRVKEYRRYKKAFKLMSKKLKAKGSSMYDSNMYSYKEYFALKKEAVEEYKAINNIPQGSKISIPNYLRDVVYSQAYYRDFEEVQASKKAIKENIVKLQSEILLGEKQVTTGKGKRSKIKMIPLTKEEIEMNEEAIKLLKKANKFTIAEIRSGKQDFLDILAEANKQLKEKFPKMGSYKRRDWIRQEFFGYAS